MFFVELGTIVVHEKINDSVLIANISKTPFFIRSLVKTNSRLNAIYSKNEIKQGEQIVVRLQYQAEQPELINETLYIYGNVEEPIVIKVYGEVR